MGVKKIRNTEENLIATRSAQIKSFIKDVSANKSIHPQRVAAGNNKIIFCVTDETKIVNIGQFDEHSKINSQFKTINNSFKASYYEIWDKVIGTRMDFELKRIYFHLYLSDTEDEYILLHTDPSDIDLTHGDYKRSPHLHIKYSKDDIIPHAHLALNINYFDKALESLDEITKCMANNIKMLSHQILQNH
ncbi:MAG: hypothetical protein KA275_06355 [Chitinophagaceae bacterium]|nr:hypothetical protein [Chitinophagaceae bacterium]